MAQRYRILHKLGHGGFGTVWMAHDLLDKKDVALKVSGVFATAQSASTPCRTKSCGTSRIHYLSYTSSIFEIYGYKGMWYAEFSSFHYIAQVLPRV